jgi:hypothetical protein
MVSDGGCGCRERLAFLTATNCYALGPFTKLGATTDEFFVDAVAGSGAFQYEVTAVMN